MSLVAGRSAGIPVVVTSCGTSGTDSGVELVAGDRARDRRRGGPRASPWRASTASCRARRCSRRSPPASVAALEPAGPLTEDVIRALRAHRRADGRTRRSPRRSPPAPTWCSPVAPPTPPRSPASRSGAASRPGPTWHAAKTVECGSQCTTDPLGGGVLAEIDDVGFSIVPLDDTSAATPMTVAAHMLYENADPFRLREPSGTLDTTAAVYTAISDRVTRVEGSVVRGGRAGDDQARGCGDRRLRDRLARRHPRSARPRAHGRLARPLPRRARATREARTSASRRASTTPSCGPTATTPCSARWIRRPSSRARSACSSGRARPTRRLRPRSRRSPTRSCSTCRSRA